MLQLQIKNSSKEQKIQGNISKNNSNNDYNLIAVKQDDDAYGD